jgi:NSS family neurotransmitter:Na+ symporter
MQKKEDLFSNRWAFILAALGMAIGAGNLWRFPRLAGQYGGSFLIPWMLFLFIWSIPLIVVEFSIGKKFRMGVIGAFKEGIGSRYAWMGWFVGLCTTGIMFYYSVVSGWSLKYFAISITDGFTGVDPASFWKTYTTGNWEPVIFSVIALLLGSGIVYGGVRKGIERASKLLIPSLFILIIIAAIKALSLPNSSYGLKYFLRVDPEDLLSYKVWLEALSQSAWSTGAGWGLILTYGTYVREEENVISNSVLTGLGNNLASLIIGLAVIPTVFSMSPGVDQAYDALRSGNQGLTFIYMPQLFAKMTGGDMFTVVFFLALFVASISSLISMIELAVRILSDYGIGRKAGIFLVIAAGVVAGFPSAFSLSFFNNQDWVWGVGLLLSGFFFIFFVYKYGPLKFRSEILRYKGNSIIFADGFLRFIFIFMLAEFLIMFTWWFFQSVAWYPTNWWYPFEEFSIGTCLLQWSVVIITGLIFNHRIAQTIRK